MNENSAFRDRRIRLSSFMAHILGVAMREGISREEAKQTWEECASESCYLGDWERYEPDVLARAQ